MKERKTILIVGSGLGGLLCGSLLAKNGYKVTVVEQHHTAGGCLQSFVRKGIKFDTGIHFIGGLDDGEILNKFWRYLDLLPEIKLQKLDEESYDWIKIKNEEYQIANGKKQFVESLSKRFPHQREALKNYIEDLYKISELSIFYSEENNINSLIENPYLGVSVDAFLRKYFTDEKLILVLLGNISLYEGDPLKTPIYLYALINSTYNRSVYRIVGGSDQIAKILVENIQKNGGEVIVNTSISSVKCTGNRVDYMEDSQGNRYEADFYISNIHPSAITRMMDSTILRKSYKERMENTPNTKGVFVIYLHFKEQTVPYQNFNSYYCKDEECIRNSHCSGDDFGKMFLYMHQCSEVDQKYANSGIAIAYMDYAEVEKWSGMKPTQRGEEYNELMKKKAEFIFQQIENEIPGFRNSIEHYYTSSPLTYEHYTKTPQGSIYGTYQDVNLPLGGIILHWTKHENLFFTGQNTYAHGFLGVSIGSLITCGEFLDLKYLMNEINNK